MDKPENYYVILGVPVDADNDTIKRAYRQLARRFHPDLAGPDGAVEMKRVNQAYAVLSDPTRRQRYDTIIGGTVEQRRGYARPRTRPQRAGETDQEYAGLSIFCTAGPFKVGPRVSASQGVISVLSSVRTVQGIQIAAGSLDGKAIIWQIVNGELKPAQTFAIPSSAPVEALRELRFSGAGTLLSGWNRLHVHVWDAYTGKWLWGYPLQGRAVSAHYSLDVELQVTSDNRRLVHMALPYHAEDVRAPNAWGVRGTDVVRHDLAMEPSRLADGLACIEERLEKRLFWAIRMRALARDLRTLVTLSCAQVASEKRQMVVVRRWDLTGKTLLGGKPQPDILSSITVGPCEECMPPYAVTPDAALLAFVAGGDKVRLCDTETGTYSEFSSGAMGGSSRLVISPDGQWMAVAREDSEINEGVIDLWSITTGQVVQKFYHPWQISALHFAENHLIVALTDGTVQVWQ